MDTNIINDNKLLADYLGLRWNDNGTVCFYPSVFNMKMGVDTINELRFHESWDWLMPILTQIGEYKYNDGEKAFIRTLRDNMCRINRMPLNTGDTLIGAAYLRNDHTFKHNKMTEAEILAGLSEEEKVMYIASCRIFAEFSVKGVEE